jgi:hypothetical protein
MNDYWWMRVPGGPDDVGRHFVHYDETAGLHRKRADEKSQGGEQEEFRKMFHKLK